MVLALPYRLVQPLGDLFGHCVFGNCCDDEAIAGHDIASPGAEWEVFWSKRLPVVGSHRTAMVQQGKVRYIGCSNWQAPDGGVMMAPATI